MAQGLGSFLPRGTPDGASRSRFLIQPWSPWVSVECVSGCETSLTPPLSLKIASASQIHKITFFRKRVLGIFMWISLKQTDHPWSANVSFVPAMAETMSKATAWLCPHASKRSLIKGTKS